MALTPYLPLTELSGSNRIGKLAGVAARNFSASAF